MMEINGSDRLRFGAYEADLHTHELWKHGTRIKLVGQPFEILAVLVKRPGQLVTRDELRGLLWPGDTFVDFNHGLNAAVNKLRDVLCDSAGDPKYIETLPRRGYRFIAAVESFTQPPEASQQRALLEAERRANVPAALPMATAVDKAGSSACQPIFNSIAAPTKRRPWPLYVASLIAAAIAVCLLLIVAVPHIERIRSQYLEKRAAESVMSNGLTPLTNVPDPTSDASFSPDGTRVAFRREGNSAESFGIFVKAVNSPRLVQLTDLAEDCCPVWSPDGSQIAFSRFSGKEHLIYAVSSDGGTLRLLYSTSPGPKRGELDWSPNGQSIVFVGESPQGTSSIYALSLRDLTAHCITEPPPLNHDWGPVFAPDGQTLAFIRTHETGLPENVVIMPAGGGESRVVVSFHNGILGPPAWTADGESIVFSSGSEPGLLRVPAFGEAVVTEIHAIGMSAWHPAIARKGNWLAFQTSSKAVSVWQSDLRADAKLDSRRVVVTDVGRNEGPQVSPDGSKLVFMSNRSGRMEIWVSDRDGADPIRLSRMGAAGTPRWSPDGRLIAFDATVDGRGAIYTIDASGGPPHEVARDNGNNLVPNWSHDGQWIYFASERTGIWQVWKTPASGGSPVQVTTHGGFAAYEWNGILYYSKFNMPSPEIWKMPIEGGLESRVSPFLRPETWANWAPVNGGIYFIQGGANGEPGLMFFDTDHERVMQVGTLAAMPFWLAAAPDGKSVLYEHLDQENNHVMLKSNFQ